MDVDLNYTTPWAYCQVKKMLQVLVTFAMATEFPITDTWATQLCLCTLPTRGFQAN